MVCLQIVHLWQNCLCTLWQQERYCHSSGGYAITLYFRTAKKGKNKAPCPGWYVTSLGWWWWEGGIWETLLLVWTVNVENHMIPSLYFKFALEIQRCEQAGAMRKQDTRLLVSHLIFTQYCCFITIIFSCVRNIFLCLRCFTFRTGVLSTDCRQLKGVSWSEETELTMAAGRSGEEGCGGAD